MTTEELRAAAELVVATGMHKDWADSIDEGAVAVCRDWLRRNPAGDAEPTEAQLLGAGFAKTDTHVVYYGRRHGAFEAVYVPGTKRLRLAIRNAEGFATADVAVPATWADVCRLLVGLNIAPSAIPDPREGQS